MTQYGEMVCWRTRENQDQRKDAGNDGKITECARRAMMIDVEISERVDI